MKKIYVLGLAILTAALMCSCGLGKMVTKYPQVTVTMDNPDLENKGGEVAYTIKGTIPPKYMKKKAVVTVTRPVTHIEVVAVNKASIYGVCKYAKASISITPFFFAASNNCAACSAVGASGFSHSIFFPASIAFITHS